MNAAFLDHRPARPANTTNSMPMRKRTRYGPKTVALEPMEKELAMDASVKSRMVAIVDVPIMKRANWFFIFSSSRIRNVIGSDVAATGPGATLLHSLNLPLPVKLDRPTWTANLTSTGLGANFRGGGQLDRNGRGGPISKHVFIWK